MPSHSLAPQTRAVIFDAYGTLFDVHSAVARHAARIGPEAARLSEIWRAKQLEYSWVLSLAGQYRPFWDLTVSALDYAFARCPGVDRSLSPLLLDAYRALDAYDDVTDVLDALRARGLKTGILSNGDPGMLADAVASAGLSDRLDEVLSVDEAGVFKTSPAAYDLVADALAMEPPAVAFVSSNRWDVAGATLFGFPSIWVNRLNLPDEYESFAPVAVIGSLRDLAPSAAP
ncbi:haloacid dehalogenase type II [Microvirga pudoricolor]|uniref:haloacid dehalogenase type II n=1 Tax=Microvirga pudoricolor TaxID=2778729 RepID=UPI00194ECA00|nr:haloacid dehalogenase type II [Microvirga pudoricolor]MBM6592428.1 haloacid dehalogenase type II [Microvirga pudoricolor]